MRSLDFRSLLSVSSAACVLCGSLTASGNVAPEFLPPDAPTALTSGGRIRDVDLKKLFRDPDFSGSAVRISFRLGTETKNVDVALFDKEKPVTVTNFLTYVQSGRFAANIIHRSAPGFVIQGGGFAWKDAGFGPVETFGAIQNEPGISNQRGTIAMAKVAQDPSNPNSGVNSATSQWFINLADNSGAGDPMGLDQQNGGFTVFGRVVGSGMSVVDEVAALPLYNAGSPLDSLPLKDYSTGSITRPYTVETNTRIIPTINVTATSSDPTLVEASVEGNTLHLTPSATQSGSATISLTATDLDGGSTEATLTVNVLPKLPLVELSAARVGAAAPTSDSEALALPSGSFLSVVGTPAVSDVRTLAARATVAAGRVRLAAIYWEGGEAGQRKLVAVQNGPAGVPNATFKSFRDPLLAPGGAIAFAATLNGVKATENEGVWTDLFGTLQPVLRNGFAVPGLGDLKLKSVVSLSLEDDALLALVKLQPVRGAVTAANDTALVRITSPKSGVVLVRTGYTYDGTTIKQISVLQPAARSLGQGRWNDAGNTLAKLTFADRRVIIFGFQSNGSAVSLLQARSGDAKFSSGLATLGLPSLGGSSVAVLATKIVQPGVTRANDSVLLLSSNGGAFTQAVSEEPGAGKFSVFSDPVVNDQGKMLFYGTARASEAKTPSTTALWLTDGTATPQIVAKLGDAAVDKEGHAVDGMAWSAFTSFALPGGPGSGPVFVAQVKGKAVPARSNLGIWAVDSAGALRQLLRTGDDVTFPDGVKRLTGFTLLNSLPGSFGARRSYNSTGSITVQATFLDRSQAILRLDIP